MLTFCKQGLHVICRRFKFKLIKNAAFKAPRIKGVCGS
tara:strand:- start:1626 stop:1739 length:114 start_codon:yes stop_codon:yes gene_type:complete